VERVPQLALVIFCFTLVVPLIVGAQSNWRTAWKAWWQSTAILLAIASPGILVGLWLLIFGR
jgi:hypothetical protein